MESLQEHLRHCTRQLQLEAPQCSERSIMCEFCSKMFSKLPDLNRHIKGVHQLFLAEVPSSAKATATCTYQEVINEQQAVEVDTAIDDLGSDPGIELQDEELKLATSTQESAKTVRIEPDYQEMDNSRSNCQWQEKKSDPSFLLWGAI